MILRRIEVARNDAYLESTLARTRKNLGQNRPALGGEADLWPSAALLLPRRTTGGTPSSERLASGPTSASQMFKLCRHGPQEEHHAKAF